MDAKSGKPLLPKLRNRYVLSYSSWLKSHEELLSEVYDNVTSMIRREPLLDQGDDLFGKFCLFMYSQSNKTRAYKV